MDRRFRAARAQGTMQLDAPSCAEYLHRLAQRPRGSEQCLGGAHGGDLLSFGAWPKNPVAPRLAQKLKASSSPPPVTLLYGDSDWMDATAGAWLARTLGDTEVMMVEKAGDLALFNGHER
eukprot:Skav228192  [mRNA]  locus=scaffold3933:607927:609362:+ [translate_table: standard]